MMITHNMEAALSSGNRTIMMNDGNVVVDVAGEDRSKLTVDDLLDLFSKASGNRLDNDRILLGQ